MNSSFSFFSPHSTVFISSSGIKFCLRSGGVHSIGKWGWAVFFLRQFFGKKLWIVGMHLYVCPFTPYPFTNLPMPPKLLLHLRIHFKFCHTTPLPLAPEAAQNPYQGRQRENDEHYHNHAHSSQHHHGGAPETVLVHPVHINCEVCVCMQGLGEECYSIYYSLDGTNPLSR